MKDWENFPNPPLRLVSFELRFPLRRRIASRTVWDAFEEIFAESLPIVEILIKEDDELQLPASPSDPVLRRTTSERDRAVTLRYDGITVETTSYSSYEDLRACINAAVKALESAPSAAVVTRLGLRYINEVRVPKLKGGFADWAPYVNPTLLAVLRDQPPTLKTSWAQGALGFHSTDGQEHTLLSHGPFPNSPVEHDGVLHLTEKPGPCFLLDIDSFLPGSAREPVATTRKEVLSVVDRLHESVETVFDWSITERLRKEVLRVPVERERKTAKTTHGVDHV